MNTPTLAARGGQTAVPGEFADRPTLHGALKRKVTLVFGHFGWRSLAAEARRERSSLEALLSAAAGYFHCELRGLAGRAAGPAGGTPAPGPRLEDRVGRSPRVCGKTSKRRQPVSECGRAAARARGALLPRGGGLRSGGHVDGERARLTLDRVGGARGPIALPDGDADRAR
jgi:hypothetical protein